MKKIGVVGSINMDITVMAERIPKKGETLKGENLRYIPGGKGANQAVAMARLGADVEMFGCVGGDDMGQKLIANLSGEGVETRNIRVIPQTSTGIAFITTGENDNTIVVVAGANDCVDIAYVESVRESILGCEMILLQNEIPQETIEYVINLCSGNNVKVLLNPGPARPLREELINQLTYITPNEHEAAIIFGKERSFEELLAEYPEKLVITQGSKGVSVGLKNGTILHIPAYKTPVVDTTGAGDTLNGAFAAAVTRGSPIQEALLYANTAAGLSTGKHGAQGGMPTDEAVCQALSTQS